ncbi:CAAX prenyl protease 2-like [Oopsacas minuta]|uniref:CAAX prenyl protease 2 n=1 Tax=Oopsacas minuta TaxID=111878 RepID=A0AAV7JJA0_9METZ|nr:CAAX prenyl protease 2-like [Oopsacas minuta]
MNYDLYETKASSCPTFLEMIGFSSYQIIAATLQPLLLSIILFLGPIVQYTIEGRNILNPSFWMDKDVILTVRALVIAPITEEIVYRGCMFPLLYSAFGTTAILLCPLLFGLAHLHHFFEWFKDEDNFLTFKIAMTTLKRTVLEVCIHTCITFIFGIYSTFLFWRTSNIISPIVCHVFCNGIGPPPIHRISSTRGSSCIIYAYIIGLVMFILLLLPLTNMYNT